MANGIAQIRRSVSRWRFPSPSVVYCNELKALSPSSWSEDWGRPDCGCRPGQLLAFIATTLVSGSVGSNVIVAQLWGARRHEDAGHGARHFLGLSILISLGLLSLGLLVNRLAMDVLGAQAT